MPNPKKGSTRPSPSSRSTPSIHRESPGARRSTRPTRRESAFSALFLDRSRHREAVSGPGDTLSDTPLARHAHWIGPWEVERVPEGDAFLHVVTRRAEPAREGGGARLACRHRQDALLGAATFAALATPNQLHVNGGKQGSRLGHPFHDGARHLGHFSPAAEKVQDDFLAYHHALRALAADPEAAALFLAALDPETLRLLGRVVMRQMA